MSIVVDTSALYALLNTRDEGHERASRRERLFIKDRQRLIVPRITMIEMVSHITYEAPDKRSRQRTLDEIYALGWSLEEHVPADYRQAEEWWRKYADWPIEYPDCLIVASAMRLNADSVWTHDGTLARFLYKEASKLKIIGVGEWEGQSDKS